MSGRVVVGVDGSETARKAVRWAAREAKLRGMKLELVSAWRSRPTAMCLDTASSSPRR
ncbi:MAG TPA: universal stress protein [Actinomycetota bacterium]